MDKEDIERLVAETHAEEQEFRGMLPSTGFLGDYMRYTDRQESPGSYHFWVGVTILGTVMQRNLFVNKGVYKVYPNLYTILIGPSGKCRKTRAMSLGFDLLEGYDWANVMADKTTPEALLAALGTGVASFQKVDNATGGPSIHMRDVDACGVVKAYELSVFISKSNYNSGMVSLLTDLYDCPPSYKYLTRNKKPIVLQNVFLTLMGASTPEWLATNLPADSFEGGFMSRVVYVVRERRDRTIALPESPKAGERDSLRKRIEEIHYDALGEISLSPAAIKWYNDWYTSVESIPVSDTSMLGFVERKPDTILKLAMILAVSAKRTSISDADLRQAHSIVTWTQERMFKAFAHVDLSPLGIIQKKIIEMLESQGGHVSRGQVLRKLGGRLQHGVNDLIEAEKVLVESGAIKVEVIRKKGPGRPEIRYTLERSINETH